MKKMIAIAMAAMLTCSLFAGCGGSGESSNSSEANAETTVAVAAENDAEATTVAEGADEEAAFDAVGNWVVVKFVTSDGSEYGLADYAVLSGATEEDTTIVYTFDEDGKAVCSVGTVAVEGTYTVNGTEIETTFTGSTPKFTYDESTGEICTSDANTQVTTYYAKMN